MQEKCSKRFFDNFHRFDHFGQKLSKIGHFGTKCPKMEVFRIFLGIPSLLFSETLQLIRAFNSEKNVPNAFSEKIPFCPFWPKIVQNWPFGWMCATVSLTLFYMGGGKFTQPKLFYLRSSKPLTVWKNPQKYVTQFRLRRFCQIFSLFEAFS